MLKQRTKFVFLCIILLLHFHEKYFENWKTFDLVNQKKNQHYFYYNEGEVK